MKLLEFKNSTIGRQKQGVLVDKSTNFPADNCVLNIKAIQEAFILAEESKKLGGGPVDVYQLAREISSDY